MARIKFRIIKPFRLMNKIERMEYCSSFVDDVSFPMSDEEKLMMKKTLFSAINTIDKLNDEYNKEN